MKKVLIGLFLLIILVNSSNTQGKLATPKVNLEDLSESSLTLSYPEVEGEDNLHTLNRIDLVDPHISYGKDVRGVYVSAWAASNRRRITTILDEVEESNLNAIVIDLKDTDGIITFKEQEGRSGTLIRDFKDIVDQAHRRGIYVIARLAVFNDNIFAENNPDHALEYLSAKDNETIIRSEKWTSPYSKEVWDYNLEIAKRAADLGVDEIKFDYIRFPTLARNSTLIIKEEGYSKSEIIIEFLKYANQELEEYNVIKSADVFGLTTTIPGDLNIGQDITKLAHYVDYLSPMIYPSHYDSGMYGVNDPDANPYPIIYRSLRDAKRKLGDDSYKLRPWLQNFSLRHRYGEEEVLDQIRAVEDQGINGWLLWNPRSVYDFSFFKEEGESVEWSLQGSELFLKR